MTIPDYQTIMLPLLTLAGDGREHSKREAEAALAHHFQRSADKWASLRPRTPKRLIDNRVGWTGLRVLGVA